MKIPIPGVILVCEKLNLISQMKKTHLAIVGTTNSFKMWTPKRLTIQMGSKMAPKLFLT